MNQRIVFLVVVTIGLSACVSLNSNVQEDLNVLKVKVSKVETSVQQMGSQNDEIREVIAGEQKRGEYLQHQLSQMFNRLQGEIAGIKSTIAKVQKQVEKSKTAKKTIKKQKPPKKGEDKFISDKMSNAPSVKDVQLALRNAGLYEGTIDGVPGTGTKKAVQAFQKNNSLASDGIVGQKTWDKLKAYL